MADIYQQPLGAYTSVQVLAANSQLEVIANLQILATMLGCTLNKVTGRVSASTGGAGHPDFNKISAGMRELICNELAAIALATDAAPTA